MESPSTTKETCPVCHDDVDIYAVGSCDHVICFKCSTRMRVLCEQMYCAICRNDLSQVIFMKKAKKYHANIDKFKLSWLKQGIFFENERIQSAFHELISHKCKFCTCLKPMKTFTELEQHVRREHNLHYCDICVRNLKLFSAERKSYDREKLGRHRRVGDLDDKSQKGHPLCELCDQRYLDRDELARHCRKEHFHCHFCESDGRSLEFFGDYMLLQDHFQDEHHLCVEGECFHARFTNAFRSELDFKAHKATTHSKAMKKSEARQARTLDVDFQLAPRPNYGRGRGRGRHRDNDYDRGGGPGREGTNSEHLDQEQRQNQARQRREEYLTAQAVAHHLNDIHRQSGSIAMVDRAILDPKSLTQPRQDTSTSKDQKFMKKTEDFPTLDGKANGEVVDSEDDRKRKNIEKDTLAKKLARASNFSVQDGSMEDRDFPSLGGRGRGKKTNASSSYKSAWQVQLESSDFPAMSSANSQKGKKNNIPNANRTNNTAQTVKSNTWVQSVSKPSAPAKPVIPVDFNMGRVNSAPKLASHSTKGAPTPADFPSLSSLGNSLLNFTPNAPGLSLTRSSSAAALIPPSWSSTEHSQPERKNSIDRPYTPPPNFITGDFPSLGGSKGNAHSKPWVSRDEMVNNDHQSNNTSKRGRSKQPAPMPDFMQVAKLEPKAETKPAKPKPKPQEDAKPQKSIRAVREEKQSKELETMVAQQTKNKQQKGKKNRKSPDGPTPRSTPDISDKEEDDVKDEPKSKKPVKINRDSTQKDTSAKYNAEPSKQSEKAHTRKEFVKNYKVDPPKEAKKDVKSNKMEAPKESTTSIAAYKVDPPRESRKVEPPKSSKKDVMNHNIGLPKESKMNKASAKPDSPKVMKKDYKVDKPKDVASYKVDKPKEVASYKVDKPKEVASYKVDKPKEVASYKVDKPKDVASYKADPPSKAERDKTVQKVNSPRTTKTLEVTPSAPVSVSSDKPTLQLKVDNFPSLSELSQSGSIIQSLSLDSEDFPALGPTKKPAPAVESSAKPAKPPPGFSGAADQAHARPPPGFVNPTSGSSAAKPPPGFIRPGVRDVENVAPVVNGAKPQSHAYIQPTDFKVRNHQLISDIQQMLSTDEFTRFKLCSGKFRQGVLSASEYYTKCSEVMGGDRFTKIFPELLSLLPDISRQQELLAAHTTFEHRSKDIISISQSGKRGWRANASQFTTCTTCRQVVLHTALSSHMSQHSTDNDFPTLSSIGASLVSWPKK